MKAKQYFRNFGTIVKQIDFARLDQCVSQICAYANSQSKIMICGNGGSASTASHYVTDWVKMCYMLGGQKLNAICLSDNIGMLTAYANDISYDDVYSKQVESYGNEGDLLVVVSGSGNSKNIIKAVHVAKNNNIKTLGIVGYDGGEIIKITDNCLHIPSFDMQICEDLHLVFGHIVMKNLIVKHRA